MYFFSPRTSLASLWCIHTILLTQIQLLKIPVLFCRVDQISMIDNLSIGFHVFTRRRMLTSLSVDEMLPLGYVNWSPNFRGLPLGVEILVDREFANGLEDRGSIPGRVIPMTLKMVLDTSLLNTQQYKVRIKGKVEQSRERSRAPHYTSVW